jgi:uncharacterized protein (DUF433 family)
MGYHGSVTEGEKMRHGSLRRYIVAVAGVRSGRPTVAGTRIGVHDVVGLHLNGATPDDIVRELPLLTRAQVYECLAYYEDHKADIDLWVAEQMADGCLPE